MNDTLAFPLPNRLALIVAPQAARARMLALAARLALQGPLRVLDAGNHFNVYEVARAIRQHTPQLEATLERIRLARAFTCHQVAAMLADAEASSAPTLLLDLLSTFMDENVRLEESRRLLAACLVDIARLANRAPVIASARPLTPLHAERAGLLEALQDAAGQVWVAEPAVAWPAPRLFE